MKKSDSIKERNREAFQALWQSSLILLEIAEDIRKTSQAALLRIGESGRREGHKAVGKKCP